MNIELLIRINRLWEHPLLDRLMPLLSSIKAWMPLLILIGVIVAWRGGLRGRIYLVTLGLALGIGDGLVARTMKHSLYHPRPHQAVYGLQVRDLERRTPAILGALEAPRIKPSKPNPRIRDGQSFPSAHVVNTFAGATVTILFFGWRWLWLYVIAAGVAYSRIYVAAHWPADIPPSILIGLLCGSVMAVGAEWAWRRWGARCCPSAAARTPRLLAVASVVRPASGPA